MNTKFTVHTKETVPENSIAFLQGAEKSFGFVPNLIGIMAESPALTKGYLSIAQIFDETSFSPTERQVITLTASRYNECHYCMAAHSVIAEMQRVPQDVVDAIRNDDPIADVKLEALRKFTTQVVDKRGWVSNEDIQAFINAGYTKQQILEVILGISFKTLSNYVNHITDTPVDAAFANKVWTSPVSK
ncbi:MAG: hypothetical protein NMNS01_28700 [Nitrosomonas sp.]|jgi:uncharacterized peroxidase-related enzyme|nr:MAG: hypothetical protein NMNS01_28700 [Nitrosomonas sp.]